MQNKTTQKTDQLWKKNDGKAQKNGSHSNIYWVRVCLYVISLETTPQ